jgi:hypothetical protein
MIIKKYIVEATGVILTRWAVESITDRKTVTVEEFSIDHMGNYFPNFITGILDYKITEQIISIETVEDNGYAVTQMVTKTKVIRDWSTPKDWSK